jgi:hypothetical protein
VEMARCAASELPGDRLTVPELTAWIGNNPERNNLAVQAANIDPCIYAEAGVAPCIFPDHRGCDHAAQAVARVVFLEAWRLIHCQDGPSITGKRPDEGAPGLYRGSAFTWPEFNAVARRAIVSLGREITHLPEWHAIDHESLAEVYRHNALRFEEAVGEVVRCNRDLLEAKVASALNGASTGPVAFRVRLCTGGPEDPVPASADLGIELTATFRAIGYSETHRLPINIKATTDKIDALISAGGTSMVRWAVNGPWAKGVKPKNTEWLKGVGQLLVDPDQNGVMSDYYFMHFERGVADRGPRVSSLLTADPGTGIQYEHAQRFPHLALRPVTAASSKTVIPLTIGESRQRLMRYWMERYHEVTALDEIVAGLTAYQFLDPAAADQVVLELMHKLMALTPNAHAIIDGLQAPQTGLFAPQNT